MYIHDSNKSFCPRLLSVYRLDLRHHHRPADVASPMQKFRRDSRPERSSNSSLPEKEAASELQKQRLALVFQG